MIPQANPQASYLSRVEKINNAVAKVLNSGWYISGQAVTDFEQAFGAWLGLDSVIGVGNGTDALELALRALGIGEGDEVISTAHTASATACAIASSKATPVLVDIDPDTFTLNLAQVEAAITPKTRAIVPVHLYGLPVDMTRLMSIASKYNIAVIEDCAQAHGARFNGQMVGTFGEIASFSFYPTKNLGAFGDGGAIATANLELGKRARELAQYGWAQRYISDEVGMNSRLDEMQAAILSVKLADLDVENQRRREIAAQYTAALADVVRVPHVPEGFESVYHLYVIRTPQRDALREYLHENGVGTAIQYPVPIHLQPAYQGWLGDVGSFPETELAATEIVSLPLYPEMTDEQVQTVIHFVQKFFTTKA